MSRVHRPASVEELRAIVAAAPRIRVLGTRHSFNAIGESAELVSLAELPPDVVDRRRHRVVRRRPDATATLAVALDAHGLALHNLASLPHICVGGAVATATHGSGDGERQPRDGGRRARAGHVDRRRRHAPPAATPTSTGSSSASARSASSRGSRSTSSPRTRSASTSSRSCRGSSSTSASTRSSRAATASACSRPGASAAQLWVKSRGDAPRRPLRRARPRPSSATRSRRRPRALHRPARPPRPVVRPAAALPHGLRAERRRRAPVRVPAPARARGRGDRRATRARRPDAPRAPGVRDPHGRRRPASG